MLAVITSGPKQFLVEKGSQIQVELLTAKEKIEFKPLLIIDGDTTLVGKPTVETATVTARVLEADKKAKKVVVLKYKPKKRQHTTRGHRQHYTVLEITAISTK